MGILTEIFGYGFGIAAELVLLVTFLAAYLSPGREITITVNYFGEANVDFLFIALLLTVSVYGFVRFIHRTKP